VFYLTFLLKTNPFVRITTWNFYFLICGVVIATVNFAYLRMQGVDLRFKKVGWKKGFYTLVLKMKES